MKGSPRCRKDAAAMPDFIGLRPWHLLGPNAAPTNLWETHHGLCGGPMNGVFFGVAAPTSSVRLLLP